MSNKDTVTGIVAAPKFAETHKKLLALLVVGLMIGATTLFVVNRNDHNRDKSGEGVKLTNLQFAQRDASNAQAGQAKAYAYIRLSNQYNLAKDYKGALQALLAADKTWPNQPLVLSDIANAYFNLHDKNNTIAYYQRAIDLVQKDSKSEYKSNITAWQGAIKQAQAGNFEFTYGEGVI